jgi:hypothetical protein
MLNASVHVTIDTVLFLPSFFRHISPLFNEELEKETLPLYNTERERETRRKEPKKELHQLYTLGSYLY